MLVKLPHVAGGMALDVDYDTEGDGSGPSYSPMRGADGGDPFIVLLTGVSYADLPANTCLLSQAEDDAVAEYVTEHHEFDDGHDDIYDR